MYFLKTIVKDESKVHFIFGIFFPRNYDILNFRLNFLSRIINRAFFVCSQASSIPLPSLLGSRSQRPVIETPLTSWLFWMCPGGFMWIKGRGFLNLCLLVWLFKFFHLKWDLGLRVPNEIKNFKGRLMPVVLARRRVDLLKRQQPIPFEL